MSRFADGSWNFRAGIAPGDYRFEVTYRDSKGIGRRELVFTAEAAAKRAAELGGTWGEVKRQGFVLRTAAGGAR